jgi:alpha-methylacyl-CoA racemase
MLLVTGVLAALWDRSVSGAGQVVDAAMVDGAGLLAQLLWAWRAGGRWSDDRGTNLLDGSAPFYRTYRCADDRFVAVGALEPAFWTELVRGLGLEESRLPDRWDRSRWPELHEVLARCFAARSRDEWADVFAGTDACVTPVLAFAEVAHHPVARARGAMVTLDGVDQPAPAPRFPRHGPLHPRSARQVSLAEVAGRWARTS